MDQVVHLRRILVQSVSSNELINEDTRASSFSPKQALLEGETFRIMFMAPLGFQLINNSFIVGWSKCFPISFRKCIESSLYADCPTYMADWELYTKQELQICASLLWILGPFPKSFMNDQVAILWNVKIQALQALQKVIGRLLDFHQQICCDPKAAATP